MRGRGVRHRRVLARGCPCRPVGKTRRNSGLEIGPRTVTSSSPSSSRASGQTRMPPPYDGAVARPRRASPRSPSAPRPAPARTAPAEHPQLGEDAPGCSARAPSASVIRFARSLTIESKPEPSTPANHRPSARPRSTARVAPAHHEVHGRRDRVVARRGPVRARCRCRCRPGRSRAGTSVPATTCSGEVDHAVAADGDQRRRHRLGNPVADEVERLVGVAPHDDHDLARRPPAAGADTGAERPRAASLAGRRVDQQGDAARHARRLVAAGLRRRRGCGRCPAGRPRRRPR